MHYYAWDVSSKFGSFGSFENRFRTLPEKSLGIPALEAAVIVFICTVNNQLQSITLF